MPKEATWTTNEPDVPPAFVHPLSIPSVRRPSITEHVRARLPARSAPDAKAHKEIRAQLRQAAKKASMSRGIVKLLTPEQAADPTKPMVHNVLGEPMVVDRFPVLPERHENLTEWGCSVAVALYLKFLAEASVVLTLMFLLGWPTLTDNYLRSTIRYQCRVEASRPDGQPSPLPLTPTPHPHP